MRIVGWIFVALTALGSVHALWLAKRACPGSDRANEFIIATVFAAVGAMCSYALMQ